MTGVVLFIMPGKLVQVHRTQLTKFVIHGKDSQRLCWQHLSGESGELDADVMADDDDTTNYSVIAQQMFDSIAHHRHENVTWTWYPATKKWGMYIAPRDVNLSSFSGDSIDEEHVGYGSLGR